MTIASSNKELLVTGPIGPTGPMGVTGAIGATGVQGPTGPTTIAASNDMTPLTSQATLISVSSATGLYKPIMSMHTGAVTVVLPNPSIDTDMLVGYWGTVESRGGISQTVQFTGASGTSLVGTRVKIATVEASVMWRYSASGTYHLVGATS